MSSATLLPVGAALKKVRNKANGPRADVYQIVTERIIALMESGKLDWRKTWKLQGGTPRNYVSGRPYRGVNLILLGFQGYNSPYWLTYKQVTDAGGVVLKGEKGNLVTFYKPRYVMETDPRTGEEKKVQAGALFRYYLVFNLEQTEGVPEKDKPKEAAKPLPEPQVLLDALTPYIKAVKQGNPAYHPKSDTLKMPGPKDFETPEEYYATFFHELIHWTGHPARLARPGVREVMEGKARFGDEVYSQEELVAELGAAFLSSLVDIGERVEQNNAAYLQSWIKVLKEDTRLIIRAAGQAQKAADHLLALAFPETPSGTQ